MDLYFEGLSRSKPLIFDWETNGLDYDCVPLGLSLHQKSEDPIFIPVDYFFTDGIPIEDVVHRCNKYFPEFGSSKSSLVNGVLTGLVAHNLKFDAMVSVMHGIRDRNVHYLADTLLMVHLYDPDLDKNLEKVIRKDFKFEKKTFEAWCGKKWNKINWAVEGDDLLETLAVYAGEDTYWETEVFYKYYDLLDGDALRVHDRMELPLVPILRDAKIRGVRIDVGLLNDMAVRVGDEINEITHHIYDEAGCVFNLNSPKQKQEVFFNQMKLPVFKRTKTGGAATDAKTFSFWANKGYAIGELLNEYSELNKLDSGYLRSIPELLDDDNVLRGDLNSVGTVTGRFCIEESQRVMTVGGEKPIKDIKVGERVYCYDDEGKLRIRKVLNVWDKGVLPLVKVKYQSVGNRKTGEILCTPNHSFKTKDRGWVMAKDLKREKVYHLRRKYDHVENGNTRPRLYGTHSFMEIEQSVIKREYFGADSHFHIHHIDGDTSNNDLRNLQVMTAEEHSRLHFVDRVTSGELKPFDITKVEGYRFPSGEEHPLYIRKGKFELLRMLYVAGGRPTRVPMDFETYKRKCSEAGIDLAEVCKRFNSRGQYISKTSVERVSDLTTREQQSKLCLGYHRIEELMEYYGVTNHLILSVKKHHRGRCYDIEVEEYNNFICEELCVHNSSSNPNLQNQPNNDKFPVRQAFVPRAGYIFGNYDYSQLELRVMAHMSKDPILIKLYQDGGDAHTDVSMRLGISRKAAKIVNFGILYGMGPDKLADFLSISLKEAESIIDNYHRVYKGFARWKESVEAFARRNGYVKTLFGRIRRLPEATKNPYERDNRLYYAALRQGVNTIIQGTGAEIVKLSTIAAVKEFADKRMDCHFLLQVHDELLFELNMNQMMEGRDILVRNMEQTVKLDIPLLVDGKLVADWSEMKSDLIPSYELRSDVGIISTLI